MAYKRRYVKRNNRKPKTWRSYAGKALSMAGKAGIKVLKRKLGLNTETKFLDSNISTTCSATMTDVGSFTTIPQGDTASTRQGSGVRLVRWKVNCSLVSNASATYTQPVRVIAYYTPNNLGGTQITPTQVLQVVTEIKSHYNMNTEGYRVIYDKVHYAEPIAVGRSIQHFSIDYAPLDHQLKWTNADTTGSVSNITAGFIAMAVMCEQGTNVPALEQRHRIHYVDN